MNGAAGGVRVILSTLAFVIVRRSSDTRRPEFSIPRKSSFSAPVAAVEYVIGARLKQVLCKIKPTLS